MWHLLAPMLGPIVDKAMSLIPDKNARSEAKEKFEQDLMTAVMSASQAQIEVNKIEAQHKSVFVAGWRPFIGWVCGLGLAWAFLGQPIAIWATTTFMENPVGLPDINTDGLYQLVLAMLGMGGLRTFEKIKGVARETSVFTTKK